MGGLFFGNSSTTWSTRSDYLAAGASEEDAPVPTTSFWGTDILRTNADLNLQNYPLDIVGGGGNNLGMGRNSTFLNELVSMNAIASRTWSLFWGWAGFGESAQFEGLAVFGGFDQAVSNALGGGCFERRPNFWFSSPEVQAFLRPMEAEVQLHEHFRVSSADVVIL